MDDKKNSGFETRYRLFLSEKDEYVPNTHVGMYSLFRNPENKSIYMSESQCQSIRQKTYKNVMELFKRYETPSFCTFFNYNADILTKLGVNYFSTHNKIAPIAELVESFPYQVETDSVPAQAISFGIEKLTLKKYLESVRNGTDFWMNPPISVVKRKKLQQEKRDFIMFGEEPVKMDYWKTVYMPRNPLFHQFIDWCRLQHLRLAEGMLMAIECLLKDRPAEGLKDITEYDYIDELDVPLYAKPRESSKRVRRDVLLSGKICAIADKIIERYNRDPQNIAKRMDFNLYCNNALHLLNQNMDLKYTDPTVYEESVMLGEVESYNDKLLKSMDKDDNKK